MQTATTGNSVLVRLGRDRKFSQTTKSNMVSDLGRSARVFGPGGVEENPGRVTLPSVGRLTRKLGAVESAGRNLLVGRRGQERA